MREPFPIHESTQSQQPVDPSRDVESPAASLSRLAGALGTTVIRLDGPDDLPAVCAQFPLSVRLRASMASRRR